MFFYEALYSRKITKLWNSPFSQLIPTKRRSCYQYVPFITLNMQLERLGWNISRPLLDHSLPEANSEASRFGLTLRQTFLWPSPTKVTSHAASFSSSHKYFVPHTFTFAVLPLVTIIFILRFNSTKLRFKSFIFFYLRDKTVGHFLSQLLAFIDFVRVAVLTGPWQCEQGWV